ncbi:hypothetical protein JTB14_035708 [Gonioctena quinquepunctata]|nr:hypothetical protein JTB14_035708 [Gonioctena quinquepunctata]
MTVIEAITEESEEVNVTLDKMIESYEIIGKAVEQVNAFLGWHIFLLVQENSLMILSFYLFVTRRFKLGKTIHQNFVSTALTTTGVLSQIALVHIVPNQVYFDQSSIFVTKTKKSTECGTLVPKQQHCSVRY